MQNLKVSFPFIGLISLLVVASLGVLMRIKIGFEFPYFDQKNLQHAHSHFAFNGWVSLMLMYFMVQFLQRQLELQVSKKYIPLLIINIFTAFGMLISFGANGYNPVSIFFSTAALLNSIVFSYWFYKDMNRVINHPSVVWFLAALFFQIISTFGTLYLIYMMVSKTLEQHGYLASVYWFLHFQYNGWFFFACVGLWADWLWEQRKYRIGGKVFKLFFLSCIPAYGLSVLWMKLSWPIYIIVAMGTLLQTIGFIWLIKQTIASGIMQIFKSDLVKKMTWIFVGVALIIKFTLQLGSTVPEISRLAFGFRPVVIAYLHLVLLAIISVFLIGYLHMTGQIKNNPIMRLGIRSFLFFVLLNELMLAIQGIASFSYLPIPGVNMILFAISIGLWMSILAIVFSGSRNKANPKSDVNHNMNG